MIGVKNIRSNRTVNYLLIEFNEAIIFIYLLLLLSFGQTKVVILVHFGELFNAVGLMTAHTCLRIYKTVEIPIL